MWKLFDKLRRTPIETIPFDSPPPAAHGARGMPVVNGAVCGGCRQCVAACPTGAITWAEGTWSLDLRRCLFCGACAEVCPNDAITQSNTYALATKDPARLTVAVATTGRCSQEVR